TGSRQKLGPVRDQPLPHRSEDIQQGSAPAGRDPVLFADVSGDGAGHDDGHRVIGRTAVHQQNQQSDPQLAAPLPSDPFLDFHQNILDSSVGAHHGYDESHHDGYHRDIVHGSDTVPHHLEDFSRSNGSSPYSYQQRQHNSADQHHKDIDSDQSSDQHHQIGKDLQHIVLQPFKGRSLSGTGHDQKQNHGDDGSRQYDQKVFPEFILHLGALGADGRDGGIGNHGQIISEHGAPHHGSGTDSHAHSRFVADPHGDGRHGCDGTHGSPHGYGDKTADYKKPRHRHIGRHDGQPQIDRTLHAASHIHRLGKAAGHQKDQTHGHDVFISHPLGNQCDVLLKTDFPVLQKTHQQRDENSHDGRHAVEISGDAAGSQKDYQKHQDRQQRQRISLIRITFHFFFLLFTAEKGRCKISPLQRPVISAVIR